MLKIKKIQLSGFRGMLKTHELNFTRTGESSPVSFVLFGNNSSGKTSFVDGFEWFLSQVNVIGWLTREDAKEKAYPHQEAKSGESFVEIEFYDSDGKVGLLRKKFNNGKITQPELSSDEDFRKIYNSFVIRPHLRYLEIIDFVCGSRPAEKYQKLASWMGFENELAFQEKIDLEIVPIIKQEIKTLSENIIFLEGNLSKMTSNGGVDESSFIAFCNKILEAYHIPPVSSILDLWGAIETLSKARATAAAPTAAFKLTEAATSLSSTSIDSEVIGVAKGLQKLILDFSEEKQNLEKIDIISLYTQAWEMLNKTAEPKVNCPVCNTEWERQELLQHIKEELALLRGAKEKKEKINREISAAHVVISRELRKTERIIFDYENAKAIAASISYGAITKYLEELKLLEGSLSNNPLINGIKFLIDEADISQINDEKKRIVEEINENRGKLQPSANDLKLIEDTAKLGQLKNKWIEIEEAKKKLSFYEKEFEKILNISNILVDKIKTNIKDRFGEISQSIEKYFSILRRDKDIKKIEITLNETKGRAAGRSAEIQLDYFNINVKPAYKVLSESLLNSLGLAVYFTCVKKFNKDCKFIILDDIMNSLDTENRETVLDLLQTEFSDFQIILFTHDYYWFQRIITRFPSWICKKIKGWDYKDGPVIDFAKTTQDEIDELLLDATKTEDAGFKLGKHIEGVLNELCENLEAEIKYRYKKSDRPALSELLDALYKRMKKLNRNSIAANILNVKKYEPSIRNFSDHPRTNYPSTISPAEVKRASEEWFPFEKELFCPKCNHYVKYIPEKDSIECYCGYLELAKDIDSDNVKKRLVTGVARTRPVIARPQVDRKS